MSNYFGGTKISDDIYSELEKHLPTIARGGFFFLLGSVLARVSGYIVRLIIARGYGASGYGLISLGIAFLGITNPLTNLGLKSAVTRYVSYYRGKNNEEGVRATIHTSLKIALSFATAFAAVSFIFSGWIAQNIFHEPAFTPILKVFAVAIPIGTASTMLVGGLIGFKRMKYRLYSQQIAYEYGKLVLVALVFLLGWGIVAVSVVYVLPILFSVITSLYLFEKKLIPLFKKNNKRPSLGKELLSYSLPLVFAGLLMSVLGKIDSLMLGSLANAHSVGLYNAAKPTAALLPIGGLISLFFPVITEALGEGEKEVVREIFETVVKGIFLVAIPVTFVLATFPKTILGLLFGQSYLAASTALSVLAIGFLISYFFAPSRNLIKAVGTTKLLLLSNLFAAASDIVFNYLLIPHFGIEGAAIATAISMAIGAAATGTFAYKETLIPPINWNSAKTGVAGAVAAIPVLSINHYNYLGISNSILSLVTLTLLFLTLYLGMLISLKVFEKKDTILVKSLEQKTGINLTIIKKMIKRFS